nr:MAG TPA: hypothetical protein [Caudoviricetes sp.]
MVVSAIGKHDSKKKRRRIIPIKPSLRGLIFFCLNNINHKNIL